MADVEFSALLCTTLFYFSSGTSMEIQLKSFSYVDHNYVLSE